MLVYADTSALVKFIVPEHESTGLTAWRIANEVRLITCDLARTELVRAVRRTNAPKTPAAFRFLDEIAIAHLDYSIYDEAGVIPPLELRSLDAIHLTAARLLGSQLDGMLTYDERLADAARAVGIRCFSPE